MIVKGGLALLGQLIGIFGEQGKAKAKALETLAANMARTWVDEIIALYWFGPSLLDYMGITGPLIRQMAMIGDGSMLFQTQVGITAAVFGLGKLATPKK
jgi:hypothetical protein